MGPMVIAASAGQVNVIVNTNFATSLETGAVTWLYFAFRLVQLPIGMFGVAVGAAVLPSLTKSITEAGGAVDLKASQQIINAMDLVAWLMIPCTIALVLSSQDITRILYEAGKFSASDTTATAIAIEAYSYGLLGYGLLKVMNSYYYATSRTRFPMFVSLISIAANYVANAVLVKQFGHKGLAMTASVTLTLNAVILICGMYVDKVQVYWRQVFASLAQLAIGTLIVVMIHNAYQESLLKLSFGALLRAPASSVILTKLDAALRLLVDLTLIVSVFASIGLWRLGKTPAQALAMLKRRK
jgi:putative peptidoglycan lipid II flippase